jgi:hypothetical protein
MHRREQSRGGILVGHQMEAVTEVVELTSQTNEKVSCVASLMKQVVQLVEMGFLGGAGKKWLAESESALSELDLEMLRAIARGAQNILLAENIRLAIELQDYRDGTNHHGG